MASPPSAACCCSASRGSKLLLLISGTGLVLCGIHSKNVSWKGQRSFPHVLLEVLVTLFLPLLDLILAVRAEVGAGARDGGARGAGQPAGVEQCVLFQPWLALARGVARWEALGRSSRMGGAGGSSWRRRGRRREQAGRRKPSSG